MLASLLPAQLKDVTNSNSASQNSSTPIVKGFWKQKNNRNLSIPHTLFPPLLPPATELRLSLEKTQAITPFTPPLPKITRNPRINLQDSTKLRCHEAPSEAFEKTESHSLIHSSLFLPAQVIKSDKKRTKLKPGMHVASLR